MKEYKCRHVLPETSRYAMVLGLSPEDAAQEFHLMDIGGVRLRGGGGYFSVIEVDGVEMVSRVFYEGIGRKGGVRPPKRKNEADTLEEVAQKLCVPADLLTGEWVGEEKNGRPSYLIPPPKWLPE